MIVVKCQCGHRKTYKNESEQLDDMPDSVLYCGRCGKPIHPDEITNEADGGKPGRKKSK